MADRLRQIARWPARRWVAAAIVSVFAGLAIGVPTVMVPSPFFSRMTPTVWWDYPLWIAASVLTGLVAATFVRLPGASPADPGGVGATASGGLLSALAVGCPVCNKIVVSLVGVSGALQLWAPLQPAVGVSSIALLGVGLARRLDGDIACPLPAAAANPSQLADAAARPLVIDHPCEP